MYAGEVHHLQYSVFVFLQGAIIIIFPKCTPKTAIIPVATNYSPLTFWINLQTNPGQKSMSEPHKPTNYNPHGQRRTTPDSSGLVDSKSLSNPVNAGPSNFKWVFYIDLV